MSSASSMVDWDLAGRTARRLMSAGPQTTREDAAAVVRELHEAAAIAVAHVEGLTGLRPVPGGPCPRSPSSTGPAGSTPTPAAWRPCWTRSSRR